MNPAHATVADARAETLHRFLSEKLGPRAMERDTLGAIRDALDDWTHQDIDDALDALAAGGRVAIRPGQYGIVIVPP
ncbi:MAG: hypothetical protein ACEQSX_17745, partial [Baekduiaceae bacterium]